MKFGTYYFFQAHPRFSHAEIIHRELEQMVWTEELGFDSVWLTEHHFIDYGLSVDPATLACAVASLPLVRWATGAAATHWTEWAAVGVGLAAGAWAGITVSRLRPIPHT